MKLLLLPVLTKLLFATVVLGQQLKPDTTINVNGSRYKIEQVNQHGTLTDVISIANVNNTYYVRTPKVSAWDIGLYQKMKKGSILNSFTDVFSDERLKKLASNEHGITFTFYILPSGKIAGVEFLLRKNTLIDGSELNKLESAIKNNVTFEVSPKDTKGADFFVITMTAIYQNVLGKIER